MEWIADNKIEHFETKIDFFKADSVFNCPALPLALKANAELIEKKMALNAVIKNNTKIVWAQVGNIPLGGICWKMKNHNTAYIVLSFTDPKYRGMGLNLLCREVFEDECIKNKINFIKSEIHIDNHASANNIIKMGFTPVLTTYLKKLKL